MDGCGNTCQKCLIQSFGLEFREKLFAWIECKMTPGDCESTSNFECQSVINFNKTYPPNLIKISLSSTDEIGFSHLDSEGM